jgi:hypothetical protein
MKNYRKSMFKMQPVVRASAAELAKLRLTFEPAAPEESVELNTYDPQPAPRFTDREPTMAEVIAATPRAAASRRHADLVVESRREGRLVFKPFADLIPPTFRAASVERPAREVVSLIG